MSAADVVAYPSLEGSEDPWPALKHIRSSSRAYQLPDQPDMYAVARFEDIRYVTTHPEIFTSALAYTAINGGVEVMIGSSSVVATESEFDDHKRKRAIAFESVKPGRLRVLEPRIRELANSLIDGFGDGRVEFVEAFSGPFPAAVACLLAGIPLADVDWVREWGALEVPGARWLPEEAKQRQAEKGGQMFAYLTEKILERRDQPGDDAISHVIAAQEAIDGEFDLDEVRAQSMIVLLGGVITTSHFLSTAMLHLLEHPDQMEHLRADQSRIPRMIEEALRLETPVLWHPRRVVQDTDLGGVPIPEGSFVLLMTAAANRDEARFDRPDEFDIGRSNVHDHVTFGYGPHFCLGAPLARLESRVAFEQILLRLHDLRLAPDNDLRHIVSPQFRGLQRLNLEFDWLAPAAASADGGT